MLTYSILWQIAKKGGKAINYCEIKDNEITVTLPESLERLEKVILASAMDYGAFGESKGGSVDEETGNYRHIAVAFPEETDKEKVETFAKKTDNAIKALIELTGKSN